MTAHSDIKVKKPAQHCYEGTHCPDYCAPIRPEYIPALREMLRRIGEL